jgi:glycosyltransferase involved in cell wall biosynthesis
MSGSNTALQPPFPSVRSAGRRVDETGSHSSVKSIQVFMMDLWCYSAYYDRYLCESLAGQNIQVTLGSVSPYPDPDYFVRNGLRNDPGLMDFVPKLRITNDTIRRVLMLVECCANMVTLLFRFAFFKPHIVHVQWTPMVRKLPLESWFLRLAQRLNIKLVYTVHNILPHDSGTKFAPVFKRIYRQMDALICHTQEAKTQLVRDFSVDPERVWVIPHGPLFHDSKRESVQTSRARLALTGDAIFVLWQGIIRSYKGLPFLLEAWRKVDALGLNAHLIVAGTGDSEALADIKEQVARFDLEKSVRLDLRFVPDEELSAYYQAADVLVFPYREVTTSGALMTAVAFQKAIVATNLPAFHEVLRNGENALLINYGDVDGLADALVRLIREPKERDRLANAVKFGGGHSWAGIARETRQCYLAVLQDAHAKALSR